MSDEKQQTHEYLFIKSTALHVFRTKDEAEAHAKTVRDERGGYQPWEMYFIVKTEKNGNWRAGNGVITELGQ